MPRMWNRQREADEAREKLKQAEADDVDLLIPDNDAELIKRVTSYTP